MPPLLNLSNLAAANQPVKATQPLQQMIRKPSHDNNYAEEEEEKKVPHHNPQPFAKTPVKHVTIKEEVKVINE